MNSPEGASTDKAMIDCTSAQLSIEEALDSELTEQQAEELRLHLAGCPACEEELRLARRIRATLRGPLNEPCPDALRDRIFAAVRGRGTPARRHWLRPMLIAAGLALLVTAAGHWDARQPEYSAAEVREAEEELRWTLAYVAGVQRRVGAELRDDILAQHVVEPVRRSAERAF